MAGQVHPLRKASVASRAALSIPESPAFLGCGATTGGYLLAQTDYPTPVAEPVTDRQLNPREEPDA